MKSDRQRPVAIVGGGFSGTIAAAQLARRGIDSVLIEGGGRAGLGTAFSTTEPAHLLNVRAASMSAWPDDPDHFVRFLDGQSPADFAERRSFGRYLRSILDEAVASKLVTLIDQRAVGAGRDTRSWTVELANGDTLAASALVLAIGNQPPGPLGAAAAADSPRFINNPWGPEARAAVEAAAADGGDVLIIGTGLTMVDMVLSLDEAGHQGRIVALSRRGQIPRAHADTSAAQIEVGEVPTGSVSALWRWLRRRSGDLGWRSAVDGLRPHSHVLWQSLPVAEQRRFIRHARPWWDVHRHRIAPQVAERIRALVADGRLELVAGRISATDAVEDGLEVTIRRRGAGTGQARKFAYAFNCTGPLGTIGRTRDPLLRQLIEDGLARPNELGIGLEIDENSRVAGGQMLWALGPLTKGRFWEIVAVPDIRVQAAEVAQDIARELGR
ncbi:MAG TPA: FAD/NAD(P)-binding protein [Sphingomicrobium sp.]|nr:FAD/NAD(P)-binding protein [Sphingomicrobium sp.]